MTTTNFFSLGMCRHLSSLAPGFEGHYGYWLFPKEDGTKVVKLICSAGRTGIGEFICPAWQMEDVLSNLSEIFPERKINEYLLAYKITKLLVYDPDTAYQKIEEYLWAILK